MNDLLKHLLVEREASYRRLHLLDKLIAEYARTESPAIYRDSAIGGGLGSEGKKSPLYQMAYHQLKLLGRPIHYKVLLQSLQEKVHVGGLAPEKTLLATLAGRKDLFINTGRGMWGLAEWSGDRAYQQVN